MRPHGWLFERDLGGGWVGAFGSHAVDFVRWVFGEIVEAEADLRIEVDQRPDATGELRPVDAEDGFSAWLRTDRGVSVAIDSSFACAATYAPRLVVNGTEGVLECVADSRLTLQRDGGTRDVVAVDNGADPHVEPMRRWAEVVRDAVRDHRQVEPSFSDGLACDQVLDQLRRRLAHATAERDNRPVAGRYRDRSHAGQVLAGELFDYVGRDDLVVPRPRPRRCARRGRGERRGSRRRSTPSSCASWAPRAIPSWRWAPSPPVASACLNDTVVRGLNVGWDAIEATAAARGRRSWHVARRCTARAGRLPTSPARPSSSSTTGSPPAPRCASPSRRSPARRRSACVVAVPGRRPGRRATSWPRSPSRSCARSTPSAFYAVGEWYDDFHPRPTRRSASCSPPRAG